MQALPSVHAVPFPSAMLAQPVVGLQTSSVQELLSLQLVAPVEAQLPAWQRSPVVQGLPSEHAVPFTSWVCAQPVTGLQVSSVQGLPSPQLTAPPPTQTPLWQVSPMVQALPSPHDVPLPSGVCVQPSVGLQASVVHGF